MRSREDEKICSPVSKQMFRSVVSLVRELSLSVRSEFGGKNSVTAIPVCRGSEVECGGGTRFGKRVNCVRGGAVGVAACRGL